jgi:hypothetical protein
MIKEARFNKTGGEDHYPIWKEGRYTRVHGEAAIHSFKEVEGFCHCNGLNSSLFSRLQAGYYVMMEGKWEFVCRTLTELSFGELFKLLTKAKIQDAI